MRSFINIITAALCFSFAACDVEDLDTPEEMLPGEETPEPEAEPEVPAAVYQWLIIEDTSQDMNTAGAPGADICGVEFTCGDLSGHAVEAILTAGAGEHCQEGSDVNGEPCYADRDDPQAALDAPQLPCEADSSPSHYVALGLGGRLALRLDTLNGALAERGLHGCDIVVHERPGREVEGYRVSVCADEDGTDCLAPRPIAQAEEGDLMSFGVPELPMDALPMDDE